MKTINKQFVKLIIITISAFIFIVAIIVGITTISSQSDNMKPFINNPSLKTILSFDQWKGNSPDNNIRFVNYGATFSPTFLMAWRFLTETNPQKEIKKKENFKPATELDTSFLRNKRDVIVWLGHSCFFIRINGISIITDPVLFNVSIAKRKSPLPFDPNLLKNIDFILISHDHRDHLDKKSLQLLYRNNQNPEILSGLKMEEWFNKMLKNPKMQTAGWYQQFETDTSKIKVFFMPARHWSKRGLWDTNKHLWGSFVIEANGHKIYFSGDTGYGSHLKQVGELFNGIDICIMGIGAFRPEWFMSPNHISPYDAVKASNEMKAKQFIPMHYGTFDESFEPLGEPIEILQNENRFNRMNAELSIIPLGKNYYFN